MKKTINQAVYNADRLFHDRRLDRYFKNELSNVLKKADVKVEENYGMDFILQRKIDQHSQMYQFNSSSVNIEKIISFLCKGEVYILMSILRIGVPRAVTDTASTGKASFD